MIWKVDDEDDDVNVGDDDDEDMIWFMHGMFQTVSGGIYSSQTMNVLENVL